MLRLQYRGWSSRFHSAVMRCTNELQKLHVQLKLKVHSRSWIGEYPKEKEKKKRKRKLLARESTRSRARAPPFFSHSIRTSTAAGGGCLSASPGGEDIDSSKRIEATRPTTLTARKIFPADVGETFTSAIILKARAARERIHSGRLLHGTMAGHRCFKTAFNRRIGAVPARHQRFSLLNAWELSRSARNSCKSPGRRRGGGVGGFGGWGWEGLFARATPRHATA